MRGNTGCCQSTSCRPPGHVAILAHLFGSIPARAGEPAHTSRVPDCGWVYPRACGGTRPDGDLLGAHLGSIPARAGEPGLLTVQRWPFGVYPRACGGTGPSDRSALAVWGLSPRVRGNHSSHPPTILWIRSIPARAGEPTQSSRAYRRTRVYPRACGGQPVPLPVPRPPISVYPRACGGTDSIFSGISPNAGLSPRVRGNPFRPAASGTGRRSIPARAGEPVPARSVGNGSPVYPRACGGTFGILSDDLNLRGLSPRVRGNPMDATCCGNRGRSIPARAGEPAWWFSPSNRPGVYPRACGGTGLPDILNIGATGLSPRVRGNPLAIRLPARTNGSIPARAGEPGGQMPV